MSVRATRQTFCLLMVTPIPALDDFTRLRAQPRRGKKLWRLLRNYSGQNSPQAQQLKQIAFGAVYAWSVFRIP